MVIALVGVSAGEDCGCGGFDTGSPSLSTDGSEGARDSFYSGLDSSPGGSSSGGTSSGSSSSDSFSTGSVSSDNAVLLTSKGLDLYKKGDFNNSLIALNASLDNDPYTPKTWMTKGDVLTSLGRYDEAITAYNRVIKLDPADPTAYAKIGDALVNLGKFNEAVASYDHALAANPGLTAVQTNRTRAVDLASGLIKGNLTSTEPTVTTVVTTLPMSTVTDTSQVMTAGSSNTSAKAPLSFIVLLMVVPIMGFVSIILKRKK